MDFRTAFLLVIWSGLSLLTVVKSAENLALSKPTNQSSTFTTYDSSKAVDGCARQQHLSDCCIHTDYQKDYTEVWWQVDLQQQSVLEYVSIIYRDEIDLQPQRLAGFELYLSNTSDWTSGMRCYKDNTPTESSMALFLSISCQNVARYVTIYNDRRIKTYPWYSDDAVLELCEVSVYGCTIGKYGNGNCNNDCLNCLGDKCHPTSGVCDVCDIGYYKNGANCILCPLGCVGNYCDRNSGYCLDCRDGYYGPLCSPCSTGCNRDTCNKTSGVCFQCDPGRYGDKCEQTCTPYCRDDLCIQSNGVCIGCKPGYYGDMCDYQCPANCRDFACLQANGKCDECIPGYYGERLTKPVRRTAETVFVIEQMVAVQVVRLTFMDSTVQRIVQTTARIDRACRIPAGVQNAFPVSMETNVWVFVAIVKTQAVTRTLEIV
ncbi:uncharacterized protein [Argopecten irradians]|uniref:uncharacterized protein n=1 Tax=Argopecten irradians TaxID=31199 RepID=UPI003723660D